MQVKIDRRYLYL